MPLPAPMRIITHTIDETAPLGYVLSVEEHPVPEIGPHEVLIRKHAAGVNRADIFQAQGLYRAPEGASPYLGLEISGIVEAIGEKVKTLSVGDEVCALTAGGGYAEYAAVEEWRVLPKPKNVTLEEAAALPEALFTCYHSLWEIAKLRPSDRVLLHGGAGGIGSTALQMMQALGGTAYVTAGTDAKCQFCLELGAAKAINYNTHTLSDEIDEVDVVLDCLGGDYINQHLSLLAPKGRYVSIGLMAGSRVETAWGKILLKQLQINGVSVRNLSAQEIYSLGESLRHFVWPHIENGTIRPIIDSIFEAENATAAHLHMQHSQHMGKIVIRF